VKLFGYDIFVTHYLRFITAPTPRRSPLSTEHRTTADDYELMIGPWYLAVSKIKRGAA
jgi:hypothetical protein